MQDRKMRDRKMQDRKMQDQKCRGGKCRTGKCGTTYTCIEKKLKKIAMHRLVTFMLSDVAVVPNVPLKSTKHAQFHHRFS